MSKSFSKVARIVGIAALAATGIGAGFLIVGAGASLGAIAGTTALAGLTFGTLGAIGLGLASIPDPPSIDETGAAARGTAYFDPNALAVIAFGRTLLPSAVIYEEQTGDAPDRVMHNVFVHCWHRISAFVSMTVGSSDGPETITFSGNAATGAYAGALWWFRALGDQVAALSGVPFDSNSWPVDAIAANQATSGLVWNVDDPAFTAKFSTVPNQVEIEADCLLLYDPREDSGAGGSGSQDFDDPDTWTFDADTGGNPVLIFLRILIGEYAGSKLAWGRGIDESDYDVDNFAAMADVCDETRDGIPRFRIGGTITTDERLLESFVTRLEAETGIRVSKPGGVYRVWVPHDDLTPITTIRESDLLNSFPVVQTIAENLDNLWNTGRGRYIEPTQGYRAFPFPEVVEATAVTEDEGPRVLNQDYSWIQDASIAERVTRYRIRRSRFPRIWTVALGWKGQGPNYREFTVHNLVVNETGGDTQLVRVLKRIRRKNGPALLVLGQEDASIYDDTIDLGDPHASNGIPNRIDRYSMITPRYRDGSIITPDLQPWTPILSNVTRSGQTFTKTGGTNGAWDAAFSSQEGFVACAVSWRFSQTNQGAAVGITSDPATDDDFDTIDFTMVGQTDGHLVIYENGAAVADFGAASYATTDQFAVTCDGLMVRYYKNGAVLRTYLAPIGARLFLDSSFFNAGAAVNSVTFGAITHVLANAVGFAADTEGKPAGLRQTYSSVAADRSALSLVGGAASIAALTTTGQGFGLPAIPVDPAKTYQITVRYYGTVAATSCFTLRLDELNAALPAGKTHVGEGGGFYEPCVEPNVTIVSLITTGAVATTTATETYTYTPTAGTKFASLHFLNNTPSSNTSLRIEWAAMTELGSNIDLLPGVLPPVDTFGLNPEAATEMYQGFAAGPVSASNIS